MIQKHSIDPDVAAGAQQAEATITALLAKLPKASEFDYGGHELHLGDYGVCEACTRPIAEAQQAQLAIHAAGQAETDLVVAEHLTLAAELFRLEAEAAIIRAELHNGIGTEVILNKLLAYQYERRIGDDYQHSHHQGAA